jgi:hypothetical protein
MFLPRSVQDALSYVASDDFWAEGKKYAPSYWRDVRDALDNETKYFLARFDRKSASLLWRLVNVNLAFDRWSSARVVEFMSVAAKIGPENWKEAMSLIASRKSPDKFAGQIGEKIIQIKRGQNFGDLIAGNSSIQHIGNSALGKIKASQSSGESMRFEPEVVTLKTRSRPVIPSPIKKYGIPIPTGRSEVYPSERFLVAADKRPSYMRDYLKSNPSAMARYRSEARTLLNMFRPTEPAPPRVDAAHSWSQDILEQGLSSPQPAPTRDSDT